MGPVFNQFLATNETQVLVSIRVDAAHLMRGIFRRFHRIRHGISLKVRYHDRRGRTLAERHSGMCTCKDWGQRYICLLSEVNQ